MGRFFPQFLCIVHLGRLSYLSLLFFGTLHLDGHIFPFHTAHGVLKARILKWFAIPFSSGPHSVRPLHHDPPIFGCPTGMV